MLVPGPVTQNLTGLPLGWAEMWRFDASSLPFHLWPLDSALGSRMGTIATAGT